jgi:hypothetical protein
LVFDVHVGDSAPSVQSRCSAVSKHASSARPSGVSDPHGANVHLQNGDL